MDRQLYNIEILETLLDYIKSNPDARFHQALINSGACSTLFGTEGSSKPPKYELSFYEESIATLARMKSYKKKGEDR